MYIPVELPHKNTTVIKLNIYRSGCTLFEKTDLNLAENRDAFGIP